MSTQINNLRSGTKNQVLNQSIDYSNLPKATSHVGHAGTTNDYVGKIWEQITIENPTEMKISIFGEELTLKAQWSVSGKSVSYFTTISNDFLESNFPIKASKSETSNLTIDFGNSIRVSNGKQSHMNLCPSLITIL